MSNGSASVLESGNLLGGGTAGDDINDWIVGENATAAFAEHDLVAFAQILKKLGPKRHLTKVAAAFGGVSDGAVFGFLAETFVLFVKTRRHLVANGFAFGLMNGKFL